MNGSLPAPLVATASSGLSVTFTSNSPSVCTVFKVYITLLTVGTCSITASQSGDAVYAAAPPVTQTFQVTATAARPIADLTPRAARNSPALAEAK